ncbi:MAG: hypothetical protein LBQ61_07570, partial [Spirochaetales bacterium]|nr:hypothetical protein [Spirochaetales bacterium]
MEVRTIFRERTILCGFSAQGDAGRRIIDLHLDDFYIRQRPAVNKISRRKNQYYGVFWWTEDNHRFHYFLGQDIGALRLIPRQMEIKILPRGLY